MPDVLTVVGARPQFIKASAVSRALAARGVRETLVHTGQHFSEDMSQVFFEDLRLRAPDHNLGIAGGSHAEMTGRMLPALERVMDAVRPSVVLVYGDTNSTLAGALAAAKLNLPVAHVEAGLRSGRRTMPEEVNRIITDHVSSLLLCPTRTAVRNLAREGIASVDWRDRATLRERAEPAAVEVGDVMLDVLLQHRAEAAERSRILDTLGQTPWTYGVLTLHRAENTTSQARLLQLLDQVAQLAEEVPVIFPIHPRTASLLGETAARFDGGPLTLVAPLSYLDFLHLQANARVVLTDSGGVQKEAFFLGVPCVTMRDETEWMETVEAGANVLAGSAARDLRDIARRATPPGGWNTAAFGDGKAAERIAEVVS